MQPLTPRAVAHPEDPSDISLVERVRAGDLSAFERVFRIYWEPLYRAALRMLRSREDAEEAVQEVFTRVWHHHATWHVEGSLRGYLLLAARNVSLNRIAHDRTAHRMLERAANEVADDGGADSPAEQAVASDLHRALAASLAHLPPKRRAICALRLVDGLSYGEIAARLGVAPKTVETQLARGLKVLRQRMRPMLE